jgi:hypothetical protein
VCIVKLFESKLTLFQKPAEIYFMHRAFLLEMNKFLINRIDDVSNEREKMVCLAKVRQKVEKVD